MPLGMEVGLGPGHIVLDRDPATPPQKRGNSRPLPNFRPMSIVATVAHLGYTAELLFLLISSAMTG